MIACQGKRTLRYDVPAIVRSDVLERSRLEYKVIGNSPHVLLACSAMALPSDLAFRSCRVLGEGAVKEGTLQAVDTGKTFGWSTCLHAKEGNNIYCCLVAVRREQSRESRVNFEVIYAGRPNRVSNIRPRASICTVAFRVEESDTPFVDHRSSDTDRVRSTTSGTKQATRYAKARTRQGRAGRLRVK